MTARPPYRREPRQWVDDEQAFRERGGDPSSGEGYDAVEPPGDGAFADAPSPDQLEQQQDLHGNVGRSEAVAFTAEEPLTPDMIEQRQVVETDDLDDHDRPDSDG